MALKGETVLMGAQHPGTKLKVLRSAAGWYLGFTDDDGQPYTRESVYLPMESEAYKLLTFLRGHESDFDRAPTGAQTEYGPKL